MFKVGDLVIIKEECKNLWFYHTNIMKIIRIDETRIYTDYWHSNVTNFDLDYLSNNTPISKECLEFSKQYKRMKKLKRLL